MNPSSRYALLLLFLAMLSDAAAQGVKPEGPATPEMLAAMNRLQEAGRFEGRRGSLTFFRWSSGNEARLAHLGLWGPKIDDTLLALTATMPDLEYVALYETSVSDAGLAALARLPRLRALAVLPIERYEKAGFGPPQWSYPFMASNEGRTRITGQALRALMEAKTLESLDLLDASVQPVDLAVLSSWPKLGSLSLPHAVDAETVRHLRACKRLSNLTLGHRKITAAELGELAAWTPLRRLTLVHAKLDADALQALSRLETLQTLQITMCGLKDEDLKHLRLPPKLTELSLSRNEINGPGLIHLAALPVSALELDFNNLGDDTLNHLLSLQKVEKLNLAYSFRLTDRGVAGGVFQRMPQLRELNLRGIKTVTDASIEVLMKLRHLEHLGIRQNGISAEGWNRLKQAMPETEVFR